MLEGAPTTSHSRKALTVMRNDRFLAISLSIGLQALRELGVDTRGLLAAERFKESDLDTMEWISWSEAARVFDSMEKRLPANQLRAFAARWLRRHPTLRVAAQFAASSSAWLDLFWRLSAAVNPMLECSHVLGRELRVRVRLRAGLGPSALWFSLMHHATEYAPELLGALPLRCQSVELTGYGFDARYALPDASCASQRVERATDMPVRNIVQALELLRIDSAHQMLRDGHPTFSRTAGHLGFAKQHHLTPKETKVLVLLAQGLVPAELARELGISVGTARVHLKHLYAKTKSSGQRELVARFEQWSHT